MGGSRYQGGSKGTAARSARVPPERLLYGPEVEEAHSLRGVDRLLEGMDRNDGGEIEESAGDGGDRDAVMDRHLRRRQLDAVDPDPLPPGTAAPPGHDDVRGRRR
jgi:hypothetical protein